MVFVPRSKAPKPIITAAAPTTSSQIVLSVGDPVNIREKPEPTEFEALTP